MSDRPLLTGALVALAVFGLLWFFRAFQAALLFPSPHGEVPGPPADADQIWLDVDGHAIEAWWFPLPGARGEAPAVLFAHGNGERIDLWTELPRGFHRLGYSTLLVEYPGYGRSEGRPSERTITRTMLAAHDWLTAREDVDPGGLVAYGRSLGGGAAARLIGRRGLAGLILESTFTSVPAMAQRLGLPRVLARSMVRDRFDTEAALPDFEGPVLLLHGRRDEIVPVEQGRQLARTTDADLIEMPCGHNDCATPWQEIGSFLRDLGLTAR